MPPDRHSQPNHASPPCGIACVGGMPCGIATLPVVTHPFYLIQNLSLFFFGALTLGAVLLAVKYRKKFLLPVIGFSVSLFFVELGAWAWEGIKIHRQANRPAVAADTAAPPEVDYTLDPLARRITPDPRRGQKQFPRHALFFGGSFTFGHGVEAGETLPAVFQDLADGEYRSLNFGESGNGPALMFSQLDDDALFEDVAQREGIAVYSFIPDHLNRTVPFFIERFETMFHVLPMFGLDDDGELVGPFHAPDNEEIMKRRKTYHVARRISPLVRQVSHKLKFGIYNDTEAVEIVAKVVVASMQKYQDRFNGEFYVIIWPRMTKLWKPSLLALIIERLESAGMIVLQPPALENEAEAVLSPADPHPGAREYRHVGEYLHSAIVSRGNQRR